MLHHTLQIRVCIAQAGQRDSGSTAQRCSGAVQRDIGSVTRAQLTSHLWSQDPHAICHGHVVAVSIIIIIMGHESGPA